MTWVTVKAPPELRALELGWAASGLRLRSTHKDREREAAHS
nr:MAG TPA: hypothetical protein [Caudoviricetes sp.]